jgi:hypothetical protein
MLVGRGVSVRPGSNVRVPAQTHVPVNVVPPSAFAGAMPSATIKLNAVNSRFMSSPY